MSLKKFLFCFVCLFATCVVHAQVTLSSNDPSLRFRTITKELNATPQQKVYFLNIARFFKIRTWNRPGIKVVARVATRNMDQYTDAQLFDAIDIFFEEDSTGIKVMSLSGSLSMTGIGAFGGGGRENKNTNGDTLMKKLEQLKSQKKTRVSHITDNAAFEIFVPATGLTVNNSFGRILLENDFESIKLILNTATLEGKNINTLSLTSMLSNIRLENINAATLNLNNDIFTAHDINTMNLIATSSTVSYQNGQLLKLMSIRDKITAGVIQQVEGVKHFGELRIAHLQKSLKLDGENADIYVQDIAATVSSVYMKNSWANVKLPLNKIDNYKLNFTGYATVFAPFTFEFIKPVLDELSRRYFNHVKNAPSNLTIDILCPQCSVDFK